MAGYKDHNFPAFFAAQDFLEELGYEVYNPAAKVEEAEVAKAPNGEPINQDLLRQVLRVDMNMVCDADCIYMLRGWERSYGARAEHALAVALGLEISYE